jgi:chromosome segregation ATPase
MTRAIRLLTPIALLALGAGTANAQTQRAPAPASAQQLQQLQQLASERTALQTENARLKADLDKAQKERDALKAGQSGAEGRQRASQAAAARSAEDLQRVQAELEKEKARLQELVARFRETANALRDVEGERNTARQTLAVREQALKACTDRNAQLYALNDEVLGRLEDDDFWKSLARREPFTRIKRTQLQNLADDYRARAQDLTSR